MAIESYYKDIVNHLNSGILQEDVPTIQKKMIELSNMHEVNAIKMLYLLIRLQEVKTDISSYIPVDLDYQSDDKKTILIHLANNQVKLAYRLLDWLLSSFYLDTTIKDENGSTVYGYLLAHLVDIYRSDNNFHSRYDLEKLLVKLVKTICMQYPFNLTETCYINRYGTEKSFLDLLHEYKKQNSHYLSSASPDGQILSMKKTLKRMKKKEIYIPSKEETTRIQDLEALLYNKKFEEQKRYAKDTYQFCKKYL